MAETLEPYASENVSSEDKGTGAEVQPLAFTIQFNDRKVDESRQLKIHERLSTFALKHRRNPSLPDFRSVKNAKTNSPTEKMPSPLNSHPVPILSKALHKSVNNSDSVIMKKWEDKMKLNKDIENNSSKTSQSQVGVKRNTVLPSVNGIADNFSAYLRKGRRSSLNDLDSHKLSRQELPINVEFKVVKNGVVSHDANSCENKSDTVSEAGTYTVDKDEDPGKDEEKTHRFEQNNESDGESEISKENSNFHHKWINDWVSKVAEQNLLHSLNPPSNISKSSGSGNSSPGRSKIPSPVGTLSRLKMRQICIEDKQPFPKTNGTHHRRSSSLTSKDYNDNRVNDNGSETESFLRTTESVVAAMQNRMKISDRKEYRTDYREKPHPPSTASDTDTNSESDGKIFKKPLGNPFSSARLNRAFSLRRAKADTENEESWKRKGSANNKDAETKRSGSGSGNARSVPVSGSVKSKPPVTSTFSRTDCGRFSMRSNLSAPKFTPSNSSQKKETKKVSSNGRSNSSLSSREVEFQNWKRRKSFDPMKAAAEGRKKELAKKAALNSQGVTQSVHLGSASLARSGNPVLRSASFHSSPQTVGSDYDDQENDPEQVSADDREESLSSWLSTHPSLPRNSPTRCHQRNTFATRPTNFSSRCSLSSVVSETHSSPSHRVRSEVLDNLVMTAINDLSYKLKFKACSLLKKLHYIYEADEERSMRLREEISCLEKRRDSNSNSPIHQSASRDLSGILKNLKSMESFLKILDEVLFDENLEVFVDN